MSVNAENREYLPEDCSRTRGTKCQIVCVEPPYVLDVFLIDDEAAERLATGFGRPRFYLGPGFRVQRIVAQDDPGHALDRIRIWDTLLVHGSVIIPDPFNL